MKSVLVFPLLRDIKSVNLFVMETALLYLSLLETLWVKSLSGGQRFISFHLRICSLSASVLILGCHHREALIWHGSELIFWSVGNKILSCITSVLSI